MFVLTGKFDGFPSPEGGRAAAEVERDIKNLAGDGAHQFSLGLVNLVVQAADDILLGIGMIVLYEWLWNAELGKCALVVTFQKEAADVAEHTRFEEQKSGEAGGDCFHRLLLIKSILIGFRLPESLVCRGRPVRWVGLQIRQWHLKEKAVFFGRVVV